MEYDKFITYSNNFDGLTLNDILKLHKNYIKVLSAIKYHFNLNSIDDVKLKDITEEQYNNIMKKIIFD